MLCQSGPLEAGRQKNASTTPTIFATKPIAFTISRWHQPLQKQGYSVIYLTKLVFRC